ncbi:unnamed protein product [Ambrosiozyma monospora]|uniref:Unnamed protein product n=1 Tax=Ambrosiozyma monospora TaxID=43982 RepID=A0ACB5SXN0_AMBMO|nr:unnamed protein product [Ambrosiozyma monospora]
MIDTIIATPIAVLSGGATIWDALTGDNKQDTAAAAPAPSASTTTEAAPVAPQKRDLEFEDFQKRAVASAPKPAAGGSSGSSGSKLQTGATGIGMVSGALSITDFFKNMFGGDDKASQAPQ